MRSLLPVILLGLLVTACQAGESQPSASATPSSERTSDPTAASASNGAPETPAPSSGDPSGDGVEVSGVFSRDSIEGGCAFLEAGDGTRYEVLWPEGWTLLRNPFRLQDPGGDIVASGGETITVRGQEANDMGSICMVGPIFRASEVVTIDR